VGDRCRGQRVDWLGGAAPDQHAQPSRQLLGSERGSHLYLDAFGREQCGHAGGIDQHVVVGLVVAAPGSTGAGHKGGDLAYKPVGFGQREPGDDRPVIFGAAGVRRTAPGLAIDAGAGGLGDRSPFSASSEISACSGGPSPAATSSAPSSLRSRAVAWDSSSSRGRRTWAAAGGAGALPSRRTCRTRRWCTAGDGDASAAAYFQVAGEAFDAGAADGEQGRGAGAVPGGELA
jgi:hypothetical protein